MTNDLHANHFQPLRADDLTVSGAYSDENDANEVPNVPGSATNSLEEVWVTGAASKTLSRLD